ncbi:putative quinol monooxygenase [Bacillus mycoides]|uniref:putative quinol monooxygenase n=1 Tax=Bacillus mycoides TaxID=1405 RepID=UPI003F7506B4
MYIVSNSNDEPNAVYVFEVWSNEEEQRAFLSAQKCNKQIKPLITEAVRISILNMRGGKFSHRKTAPQLLDCVSNNWGAVHIRIDAASFFILFLNQQLSKRV